MASVTIKNRATLDDLLKVKEKAELIDGRIIRQMPTGLLPNRVAGRIYRLLAEFAEAYLQGESFTDNLGYIVDKLPSGRESFSPDVSYYDGPLPENLMRFVEGPPTFAVEVRSETDYTSQAERDMAAKRADYFAAGTKAVWDVDPINQVIRMFDEDAEQSKAIFRVGDTAHAEPAVPGWRVEVGRIFH